MRWGILATGTIAGAFARDLRTSETGELIAVASRTDDAATRFAAAHGVPRAHGSYDALLADDDVDAVYIATPHPMHAPWAIAAAEAGKHVLCEKPLTTSEVDTTAVVEAARRSGTFLMEAFMYRCHPQTARFVDVLSLVGEVRVIEAVHSFAAPPSRRDPAGRLLAPELGGGGILDVGCYCVSGALLVTGEAPTHVSGTGHVGATGVDEWAVAALGFDGGVVAHLSCGIGVHQPPVLRVHGSAGSMAMTAPWLPGRHTEITIERDGKVEAVPVVAERGLYAYEADVVARCVAAGLQEAPEMPWSHSLATARVLDAWRAAL